MPSKRSLDVTLALPVTAEEAAAGTKKRVEISRIVRCPKCFATYRAGPGCEACEGGLVSRDEVLFVVVPAGVERGQELRLAGKGHESARDDAGDLYLAITLPATTPVAPEPPKTTLVGLWKNRETRPAFFAVALIALPFVLWGADRAIAYTKRAPVGAACAKNDDCASSSCMSLYERDTLTIGTASLTMLPRKTGAVCTTECETDADCPSTMTCAPASASERLSGMPDFGLGPGTPNTRACSPVSPAPR